MMKSRKLSLYLLISLALAFILVACQGTAAPEEPAGEEAPAETAPEEEEQEESTLERARREGVIRVGFANENPYAFAQPDGTLSGEAVEVARAVFQNLGIAEMEGVLTQFG